MSKSVGNVISPDEIINKYGADILRIWVVASDYSEDLKIDNQIINYQIDSYRKIRNTLRFLLGNLNNFNKQTLVDPEEMPELERYLLTRISILNEKLKELVSKHDYHAIYTALLNFCTLELSAFYFDIRKDSLYCDDIKSIKRRSTSTCLHIIFEFLTKWLSPIVSFTCEEAWKSRSYSNEESILLQNVKDDEFTYKDISLEKVFEELKRVRKSVTSALELKRNEKLIGSSLQAKVILFLSKDTQKIIADLDLAEMCIVSNVETHDISSRSKESISIEDEEIYVDIKLADGKKCERCWAVSQEVSSSKNNLCNRCEDVWKSFQQ